MWEQSRLFCMTCYGSGWGKACAFHMTSAENQHKTWEAERAYKCTCVPCKDCNRLTADGVDTRWLPV